MSQIIGSYPAVGGGVNIYANLAAFPVSAKVGTLAVAQDTGDLYEYFSGSWQLFVEPTTHNAITALTTDVTATGPGSVAATVRGLQGHLIDTTAPTSAQYLIWNSGSSKWTPTTVNAITALTGDVTATGPGSVASVVTAIQNQAVSSNAPSDKQVLTWSAGSSRWLAANAPVGPDFQGTYIAYVSPYANAGIADGSIEKPFATMAAAIAAGPAFSNSPFKIGVTLLLLPGAYNESQVAIPHNFSVVGVSGPNTVVCTNGFTCDGTWGVNVVSGYFAMSNITTGNVNFNPVLPLSFNSFNFYCQGVTFTGTYAVSGAVSPFNVYSSVFNSAVNLYDRNNDTYFDCTFLGLVTITQNLGTTAASTFYRCALQGGLTLNEQVGASVGFTGYNSFATGTLTLQTSNGAGGTLNLSMDPATYSGFTNVTSSYAGAHTVNFTVTGTTPQIESTVRSAAVALTSTVTANLLTTPLTLQAGTYDLSGGAGLISAGFGCTAISFAISKTSATLPASDTTVVGSGGEIMLSAASAVAGDWSYTFPTQRITVTTATIFYLVGNVTGTGASAYGIIQAVPVV